MPQITILIPHDQTGLLGESIDAQRRQLLDDIAERGAPAPDLDLDLAVLPPLIDRLEAGRAAGDDVELTAAPDVLWNALYDIVCQIGEDMGEDCLDLWGGRIAAAEVRRRIADLSTGLELLVSIGPAPS